MRTLARAARSKDDAGDFLPPVFLPLEQAKIRARAGTVTMIMGPPGAFKTGFVLYWALRLGLPSLYWSADCESFEMVERSAAAISGDTMDDVRRQPEKYAELLGNYSSHMRFVFNDAPSYDDIEADVAAYAEVHGAWPKLLVLDNLMNVVGENENEWSSLRDTAKVLHRLTRITKAAIFVLHHAADDRTDPTTPAPRRSLQGKVSQLPKVILSVAIDGNELRLAPVKLRWGPGDASGSTYASLYVDAGRNRVFNTYHDMLSGRPA